MLRIVQTKSKLLFSAGRVATYTPAARFSSLIPFKLADIGEGIAEVELMKWFVQEGDTVKAFDRLCEVQSDKATVEITSRYNGVIAKIYHAEGAIVKVGDSLLDMLDKNAVATEKVEEKPATAATPAAVPAAALGAALSHASHDGKILTTPAVRKMAKENNINLSQLVATGPKGRVTKEDVLRFLSGDAAAPAEKPRGTRPKGEEDHSAHPAAPKHHVAAAEDKKFPIRGVGRLMVKSMTAANAVPHLTLCEEVVFDNLKRLRSQMKSSFEKKGLKLSYMPLIIKATSLALHHYPMLNASLNAEATELTHHAAHNIGIAMDTPKGLIVPVIRNVEAKSVTDIAREIADLQRAANAGTLTEAQLSGGTFSLSNIGSIGGTYAVPVLVVPQVVIGAFGRLQVVPKYMKDGREASSGEIDAGKATVQPVNIMNVSWSADHRVVDGATVARFSNLWKSYLEDPSQMLVELK